MADDGISASSLGDLPNAGYQTETERLLTDVICEFMRQTERNRILLLSIVIDGPRKFRYEARKAWKHLPLSDHLLDKVYEYFVQQAGKYPIQQRDALLQMDNRQKFGLM